METIANTPAVRPMRWFDYIYYVFGSKHDEETAWKEFAPIMPWGLIDPRLVDLAKRFAAEPEQAIMLGFRRLEDTLRARTGLPDHAVRLASLCFHPDSPKLSWDVTRTSRN